MFYKKARIARMWLILVAMIFISLLAGFPDYNITHSFMSNNRSRGVPFIEKGADTGLFL
jgi:hypothetical protein